MKKLMIAILSCMLIFNMGCGQATDIQPEALECEEKDVPDEFVGKLCISELMRKNKSSLKDEDGDFTPWAELLNCGDEALQLEGWGLSDDGKNVYYLPEKSLDAGERIIVYLSGKNVAEKEIHADFKLSKGESLYLSTPKGSLSQTVELPELPDDRSFALKTDKFMESKYPTPGFSNDAEGFENYQNSLECSSPVIINEVMAANKWKQFQLGMGDNDWVELKNVSDEAIDLSDYYLSDSKSDYFRCKLPEKSLNPGEKFIVLCSKENSNMYFNTGFSLSASDGQLYLSTEEGLADYISLRDIPYKCSLGRLEGEAGFFYFDHPSPRAENKNGIRRISEAPSSRTKDGVFNDIDSMLVELSGEGTIYYTLDGSLPSEASTVYEGPIKINKTTVIRAAAKQEGAMLSRPLMLSFIINENHSLPVLSLAADDPKLMFHSFFSGSKEYEMPGSAEFFEGENSFKINCGIKITGNNSRQMLKKSMKINFRGAYGDSSLDYDVFGVGETGYKSLAVRAGQDNHRLIFRQEIWQVLCLNMTDKVPTQHSKFCILYIDGQYCGIFCIKEDISEDYYAKIMDVDPDSVESIKLPSLENKHFYNEVFRFCTENDLSEEENYKIISQKLDIDSFIDYVIVEGVSGNVDLFNNIRFFRSPECGGRWQPVLFDMDHTLVDDFTSNFSLDNLDTNERLQFKPLFRETDFCSQHMNKILSRLLKNEEFRHQLIERYSEVYNTALSNESILERMDYYEKLLQKEVERDWLMWFENPEKWPAYTNYVRQTIKQTDWERTAVDNFCKFMNMSEEDKLKYFP